jgi:hypothetical protein
MIGVEGGPDLDGGMLGVARCRHGHRDRPQCAGCQSFDEAQIAVTLASGPRRFGAVA